MTMRGDTEDSRSSSPSPARTTIGSSPANKTITSNGSVNGKSSSNGVISTQTNGNNADALRTSQSTFYGHDREEVTRILIQGLSDLGYEAAAGSLSRESGYDLETPYASAFRTAILQGDWEEAEDLLSNRYLNEDINGGVSIDNGSEGMLAARDGGIRSSTKMHGGLQLSQAVDRGEMLFLMRRQKYLELLERRDLSAALAVLRQELRPLNQDERQLHALSSYIMCQSSDDLKAQADWDGSDGESRKTLLADLTRFISPAAMIPDHRLAELLTQVKEYQTQNCLYHNDKRWPSLYTDHGCERHDFPLETICELGRHTDEVWYLQFSNDGTRLATASKDTSVIIYETDTFGILHIFKDHNGPIAYVAWSPDDRRLVSCSQDHSAKLWDTETGACLRTMNFNEPVTTAAWAPDGKTFFTGSLDIKRPLTIWPAELGPNTAPIFTFEGVTFRVHDCALAAISPPAYTVAASDTSSVSSDARPLRLVAIGNDLKTVHVFDYTHHVQLGEFNFDHKITCLNLSRDGRDMLLNLSNGEVWIMSVDDGDVKQKFKGQKQGDYVIRNTFGGPNEGCVVSGGEDAKISIWHRYTGRLLSQLSGHRTGCVNAVAWNVANPSMFASAGDDHKVRVWSKELSVEHMRAIRHGCGKTVEGERVGMLVEGDANPFNGTSLASTGDRDMMDGPPMWGDYRRTR